LLYNALRLAFSQIAAYSRKLTFQFIQKLPKQRQIDLKNRFVVVETGRDRSLRMDAADPPISINDIFRNGINDDYINAVTQTNVELINIAYKEHYAKIQELVIKGAREGISSKLIGKEISDLTGVSKSKAEFWAQDQSSKFFGEVTRFNQTSAGYDGFIWRTVRDSRVRPVHQDLEGKFFTWKDGSNVAHAQYPGRDYRCRCFAEPAFKDEQNPSIEGRYKFAAERQRTEISLQTGYPLSNTIDKIVMDNIFKNPTVIENLDFIKANAVKYGLSVEESAIIYSYTIPDYYWIINLKNREQLVIDSFIEEYTRALNIALDKFPNYQGIVYKGIGINFPDSELEKIFQSWILKQPYEIKGFNSTSTDIKIADLSWRGENVKAIFIIKSKTGRYIENLSGREPANLVSLEEVLFNHPSKYEVIDYMIDKDTKIRKIYLEEL